MTVEKALEYAAVLESHDPATLSLDEWRIVKIAAALRSAREDGARLEKVTPEMVEAFFNGLPEEGWRTAHARKDSWAGEDVRLALQSMLNVAARATRGREMGNGKE